MTNAAQGNPQIPVHPEIAAQHRAAQAQSPQNATNSQQPAQQQAPSPEIDWAALAMGMDDIDSSPQQPQAPAAQPNGQAPNGQAPQPQPGELTPEQKAAIAQTEMEQLGQAPAQPQSQQQPVDQNALMSQAADYLLNTTYKMSDEQKRQLVSEPDVAIPQLAARMHVQIASQLGQHFQQVLSQVLKESVPQVALQAMNKQMGAFKAEQTFFSSYPALQRQEWDRTSVSEVRETLEPPGGSKHDYAGSSRNGGGKAPGEPVVVTTGTSAAAAEATASATPAAANAFPACSVWRSRARTNATAERQSL